MDTEYTSFTYADNSGDSSKNLISKVRDIDGYALNYTYTSHDEGKPARVASVTETETHDDVTATGGSLTIKYAQNQTTLTDQSGNVQVMQFNNWGNTVSVHNNQGRAQYAGYASSTPNDGEKGTQLVSYSYERIYGTEL